MAKISVLICSFNAQETIGPACESAKWADEILVVDSNSTDKTAEIARQYTDRVIIEPWRGHTATKKYAMTLTAHDWVFIVDSDETCPPELAKEIRALPDEMFERYDVISVRRRNYVMGRYVRAWNPDWLTRLVHRHRCVWSEEVLHDYRNASHPSRHYRLRYWLEHKKHSKAEFRDVFDGALEDSRLLSVARQMYDRGKRCHWWDLVFRPAAAFCKFYFIKGAWMDGSFGLIIGQKASRGSHLKYAALWAVQNGMRGDEAKKPR